MNAPTCRSRSKAFVERDPQCGHRMGTAEVSLSPLGAVSDSLDFHLHPRSIGDMSISGRQIFGVSRRSLSRLMVGLFAMQVMVAGFCLLTSEAHAMPQSVQQSDMDGGCAKGADGHHLSEHSDSCYHCDQPDVVAASTSVSVSVVAMALPGLIRLAESPVVVQTTTGLFSPRPPTGPPRSASLLFSTTQRIRV